jgi:hypothetical protein
MLAERALGDMRQWIEDMNVVSAPAAR